MTTLKEIMKQIKEENISSFGNLEERVSRQKGAAYTREHPNYVESEAKYLARQQILHLMGKRLSVSQEIKIYREFFKQKIGGKYILLPINNMYQVNLQESPALRKLLDEGFIKMHRARMNSRYKLKKYSWKPSGKHQTYLTFNENNVVQHNTYDV